MKSNSSCVRVVRPGENGAKKLQAEHGSQLLAVRYRIDRRRKLRLKTIELIVARKSLKIKKRAASK